MATGTVITLSAGVITFTDKWYWAHEADWKIAVATLIAGAGIDLLSRVSDKGATALSVMILIGASTTKFNGHSAVDTITSAISSNSTTKPAKKKGK